MRLNQSTKFMQRLDGRLIAGHEMLTSCRIEDLDKGATTTIQDTQRKHRARFIENELVTPLVLSKCKVFCLLPGPGVGDTDTRII